MDNKNFLCKNCKKEVNKIVGYGLCRNCYNGLRSSGELILNAKECLECHEIKDIYAKGLCRKCYDKTLSKKKDLPKEKSPIDYLNYSFLIKSNNVPLVKKRLSKNKIKEFYEDRGFIVYSRSFIRNFLLLFPKLNDFKQIKKTFQKEYSNLKKTKHYHGFFYPFLLKIGLSKFKGKIKNNYFRKHEDGYVKEVHMRSSTYYKKVADHITDKYFKKEILPLIEILGKIDDFGKFKEFIEILNVKNKEKILTPDLLVSYKNGQDIFFLRIKDKKVPTYTLKCDYCGKSFPSNNFGNKLCSPYCKKTMEKEIKILWNSTEFNDAYGWYVWAKENRYKVGGFVTYESIFEEMQRRAKREENSLEIEMDEEILDNFLSAIAVFKKFLEKYKHNRRACKQLLNLIASVYFHAGFFGKSCFYYELMERDYGKASNQYKHYKELAQDWNKFRRDYYTKKRYSEYEIDRLVPVPIKQKADFLIELAKKYFDKTKVIKSFIRDKYEKIIQSQTILYLGDFDGFKGLPALQIFRKGNEGHLQIELGTDLTPSTDYSFFIVAKSKEEIHEIILSMNRFIKLLNNFFDVEYHPYIHKTSKNSFLDDYGDVLNCSNIDELQEIVKKAKKKRWKFVMGDSEGYFVEGIISITPKGYKVELEDKFYIKGPDGKMDIIDLKKIMGKIEND